MSTKKFEKTLLIYKRYLDRNKTQKNPVSFGEFLYELGNEYTGLIFWEEEQDLIGASGGCPTWGYLYKYFGKAKEEDKLIGIGDVIHKEYDYDNPNDAYNEKIYSLLAKKVIKNCRIPNIDVAYLPNSHEPTTLSYCIFDKDKEEMFEIKDFLYNKFERKELKEKEDIVLIEEILECIKMSLPNQDCYKEIEESLIQVLILDSIVNNPDRHPNNWAVVRSVETGKYSLGIFDNSRAFYNMTDRRPNDIKWASSYVLTQERRRNGLGDDGEKIIKYLKENYPEYFNKFLYNFIDKLPEFYEDIEDCPQCIDIKYLKKSIEDKLRFIRKMFIKEKGEDDDRDYR